METTGQSWNISAGPCLVPHARNARTHSEGQIASFRYKNRGRILEPHDYGIHQSGGCTG